MASKKKNPSGKTYFFDKQENINLVLRVFYVLCAMLFAADFVINREIYHSWEKLPGFYAIFGFVACVLLVLAATQMRKVLMRDEDYYTKQEDAKPTKKKDGK